MRATPPPPIQRLLQATRNSRLAPLTLPIRWVWLFYRGLQRDHAFMRAAGMGYATLMALVPMMVLVYGVIEAVGAGGGEQDLVLDTLIGQVLGEVPGVRDFLLPGLQQVNLATLGVVSVGGLLFVAGRLFMMVEQAYCDVFGVPVRRRFLERALNFYVVMTAVPVIVVVLTRGTLSLAGGSGWIRESIGLFLQFALLVAALKLFPTTSVRWGPALGGAAVSFVLIELGRQGFALYIRLFASDDPLQVVYGSLGLIPLFLLWMYLLWLFVLLGAQVANVAQNYQTLFAAEFDLQDSHRRRRPAVDTALQVAFEVSDSFLKGDGPIGVAQIATRASLDSRLVRATLSELRQAELVVETGEGWLPARPPDSLQLSEVVRAWREVSLQRVPGDPLHDQIDAALALPGTLADGRTSPIRATG